MNTISSINLLNIIIARNTYQYKYQAFINNSMKQELKYLEKGLTNIDIFKLETSISHSVD